jgi:hypothetical protein
MRVTLVWADDGAPVPRAWVAYRPLAAGPHQSRSVECQPDGVARIGDLAPGRYAVSVASQETQQLEVAAGATSEATLRLRPEVVIDGVVVDQGGKPVAGAAIRTPNLVDLPVLTTSRADGTFAWRGLYLSEVWAEKDGRKPSRQQLVNKFEGKPHTLRFVLGGEGVAFSGLVLHANGSPAADAWLAISVEEGPAPLALPDGQPVRDVPPVTVHADGAGRFRTGSVPTGRHWLVASAQGSAPVEVGVDVVADAEPTVIRLAAGATVRGVIRDRDGKPVAARVNGWGRLGGGRGLFPLGGRIADAHSRADADAEGRYVLAHLPAGRVQLHCMAAGMATAAPMT